LLRLLLLLLLLLARRRSALVRWYVRACRRHGAIVRHGFWI
jgi:hypothetical protein